MPRCGSHRPNVLLVVLDSVRAASCSLYGADRETSPFLDQYARRATVYEQARAPSNWTVPSHVSLFTGLETSAHGVGIDDTLQSGHTIFDRLEEQGYDTGLFTENGFVASHEVGLHRPFDTVETVPESTPARYDTREESPGPDGFYYTDACLDWIDQRDGPWAGCLNLMDAHRPYEPRPIYDRWGNHGARDIQNDLDIRWEWDFYSGSVPMWHLRALETLYQGGIRQDDAVLRRLIAGLERRGLHDETLVVIVGDHGEGFGEPGQLDGEPPAIAHITPMQESLLHVPLVVSAPGQKRPFRVSEPAALTRFPSVVTAYTDRGVDGPDTGRFVPSGPVVASKQPVTGTLRERYERRCEDPERFFRASHAVYTDDERDGAVRKRYHWGRAAGEFRIEDTRSIVCEGSCSRETIDRVVESHAEVTVGQSRDEPAADADTEAQLSALGYF
jgi:arylsulfatase A